MKNFITKTGIGTVIALCSFAIPGQASTVIDFASTGNGGTITTPGNSGTQNISTLTATNWTTMDVTGAGEYNGWWTINASTFTLSGSGATSTYTMLVTSATCNATNDGGINGAGGCSGWTFGNNPTSVNLGQILTIAVGATPTGSVVGSAITVNIGTSTTLSDTATFLTDLGLSTAPGSETVATGSSIKGNSVTGTGPYTFTTNSSTLNTNVTSSFVTPEPMSFLLLGGGLFLVALVARMKARETATVRVD